MVGQTLTGREHTIVSVAERISRQFIPIFLVITGLGFLSYQLWGNDSYFNGSWISLGLCGFYAPVIQSIGTLLSSKHQHREIIAVLDTVVSTVTVLSFAHGAIYHKQFTKNSVVKYSAELGLQINMTISCLAAIIIVALAFWPSRSTSTTRNNQ